MSHAELCQEEDSDLPTSCPQGHESMVTTVIGCWHRGQGLLWALAPWTCVLCTFAGPPWVPGCLLE